MEHLNNILDATEDLRKEKKVENSEIKRSNEEIRSVHAPIEHGDQENSVEFDEGMEQNTARY